MRSESPFDRLGTPVAEVRDVIEKTLYGGLYENPFTIAHETLGEWREWRTVLDYNDIENPFILRTESRTSLLIPQLILEL